MKIANQLPTYLFLLNMVVVPSLFFAQPALADDLSIGKGLYAKGDYNKAAEVFQRVLKKDGSNSLAHYYMGNCYVAKHDWGEAKAEYQYAASYTRDPKIRDYCQTVVASIEAGHPGGGSYSQASGSGSSYSSFDAGVQRGQSVMNHSQSSANSVMEEAERQCRSIAQDRDNALAPSSPFATRATGVISTTSAEDRDAIARPYNDRIEDIRSQARAKANDIMKSGEQSARRAATQ